MTDERIFVVTDENVSDAVETVTDQMIMDLIYDMETRTDLTDADHDLVFVADAEMTPRQRIIFGSWFRRYFATH